PNYDSYDADDEESESSDGYDSPWSDNDSESDLDEKEYWDTLSEGKGEDFAEAYAEWYSDEYTDAHAGMRATGGGTNIHVNDPGELLRFFMTVISDIDTELDIVLSSAEDASDHTLSTDNTDNGEYLPGGPQI